MFLITPGISRTQQKSRVKNYERIKSRVFLNRKTGFWPLFSRQSDHPVKKTEFTVYFQNSKYDYLRMFNEFDVKNVAKPPDLMGPPKIDPKSPVRQLTGLFTNLLHSIDKNNTRLVPWKVFFNLNLDDLSI
jgi:hypothetical protein